MMFKPRFTWIYTKHAYVTPEWADCPRSGVSSYIYAKSVADVLTGNGYPCDVVTKGFKKALNGTPVLVRKFEYKMECAIITTKGDKIFLHDYRGISHGFWTGDAREELEEVFRKQYMVRLFRRIGW